jgi:hypothetical protein
MKISPEALEEMVRERVLTDSKWLPYAMTEVAAEHLGLEDGGRWALDAWEGLPMLQVMREHMPVEHLHGSWPVICRIKAASLLDSLIRAGEAMEARISREVERRIELAASESVSPV